MHKFIENIFSQIEIDYLKDIIKEKENLKLYDIRPETGRIAISLPYLKPEIIDKVEKIIKNNYGKDYKVKDIGFHRYKLEYGHPKLKPHVDDGNCEIVFDYQIEANKKWDVVVNGNSIGLNDNDAVIFEGEKDAHWRKPIRFNSNEYVSLINFNAVSSDHWSNFTEVDPISPTVRKLVQKSVFKEWKNEYFSDFYKAQL
jgi:hypothetical protein